MRLIDADALIKAWRKKHNIKEGDCGAVFTGYSEIPRLIDEQPIIDAVEVVRCKDCKHYDIEIPSRCIKDRCYCATVDSFMKTTDYCSYAERRSDDS